MYRRLLGVRPPGVLRRLAGPGPSMSGFALLLGLRGRTPALGHHTVFFPRDYDAEFDAVFTGRLAADPTIYVSKPADPALVPDPDAESWFVLVNAPPHGSGAGQLDWRAPGVAARYAALVLDLLARRGFDVRARVATCDLRTPADIERDTGSPAGSIYGMSMNGRGAALLRPANRSPVKGLFLAGGSVHPGGGSAARGDVREDRRGPRRPGLKQPGRTRHSGPFVLSCQVPAVRPSAQRPAHHGQQLRLSGQGQAGDCRRRRGSETDPSAGEQPGTDQPGTHHDQAGGPLADGHRPDLGEPGRPRHRPGVLQAQQPAIAAAASGGGAPAAASAPATAASPTRSATLSITAPNGLTRRDRMATQPSTLSSRPATATVPAAASGHQRPPAAAGTARPLSATPAAVTCPGRAPHRTSGPARR